MDVTVLEMALSLKWRRMDNFATFPASPTKCTMWGLRSWHRWVRIIYHAIWADFPLSRVLNLFRRGFKLEQQSSPCFLCFSFKNNCAIHDDSNYTADQQPLYYHVLLNVTSYQSSSTSLAAGAAPTANYTCDGPTATTKIGAFTTSIDVFVDRVISELLSYEFLLF